MPLCPSVTGHARTAKLLAECHRVDHDAFASDEIDRDVRVDRPSVTEREIEGGSQSHERLDVWLDVSSGAAKREWSAAVWCSTPRGMDAKGLEGIGWKLAHPRAEEVRNQIDVQQLTPRVFE